MPVPKITKLPTPPNRTDAPAVFVQRADEFLSPLPQFGEEINVSAEFVNTKAAEADASAQAASTARNAAQQAASQASTNGAAQVQLAAGYADDARESAETARQHEEGAEALLAAVGSAVGLPSLAGAEGKALTANAGGVAWSNEFSRYTLASGAATAVLDLAARQVFRIDASVPRTLSLANAPGANRAMAVVIHITGSAGVFWPANIEWDSGRAPKLGANFTRVKLLWDGVRWTGPKEERR